jgi:hypothetical protein
MGSGDPRSAAERRRRVSHQKVRSRGASEPATGRGGANRGGKPDAGAERAE